MKKGVFGSWFKELASLIFTQTVQAFLLAIIMSIIVNALSSSSGNGGTYGAGLLAIIALSQFGKIELLIKNIFGVTSQFGGSMQDGKGGLLGAAMALKMGKKVLDNGSKVVDGNRQKRLAKRELSSLTKERDSLQSLEDADAASQAALGTMQESADKFIDDAQTGAGMAAGAQAVGGTSGSSGGVGMSSSQIDQLISAIKEQTTTIKSQKLDSDKSSVSDKKDALDKKILEAQNKMDAGKRLARSGKAEFVGDAVFGVGGAMVGLAQGEGVAKNAMIGAGIADSAISGTSKRLQARADYKTNDAVITVDNRGVDRRVNENQAMTSKARKNEEVYNSVKNTLDNANKSGFMKNRTSQDRANAVKKLQENAKKKIDASNM